MKTICNECGGNCDAILAGLKDALGIRVPVQSGQRVTYTFYGRPETAKVDRVANGIVWLDNGRWMHETSVTEVRS